MSYVVLNEQGYLIGSYPDGVWNAKSRPQAAKQVTHDVWQHLLNGGRLVDGQCLGSQSPSIEKLRASKRVEINAAFEHFVNTLVAAYPTTEQQTWPYQLAEAQAYAQDNTAATPHIALIADAEGKTVAHKVQTILQKAADYADVYRAIGERHRLMDLIEAAQLEADLDGVVWSMASGG